MKFVLASHNKGKLAEMQKILGELGVEVVLQSDLGLDLEPEENGATFTENARIKARAVMEASGLPAIADDSGLCVLLQNMRGSMTRAAHFHTSVVCLFPDGTELTAEGECPGTIAYAPMGDGGFGYDPVFDVPSLRKTFAQMTPEEKNAISHRGNALRSFGAELKEYLEKH